MPAQPDDPPDLLVRLVGPLDPAEALDAFRHCVSVLDQEQGPPVVAVNAHYLALVCVMAQLFLDQR